MVIRIDIPELDPCFMGSRNLFLDAISSIRLLRGSRGITPRQAKQSSNILHIRALDPECRRVGFEIIVTVRQPDACLSQMADIDAAIPVVGSDPEADNGAVSRLY